jgi:peptidoglycan hydrolase-like protein with peptidoglycan-binding domain
MTGIVLVSMSTAGVASAATPDPQPPVVSLISPTPGAGISQNSEILLYATASDPDGTIAKVEFYDGSSLLGTDTTPSYWYAIPPRTAALGAHTLTARAYDDQGLSTTSTAVTVYVIPPSSITVTGYVRAGVEAGCMLLVPDYGTPGTQYLLLGGDRTVIVPGAHLRVTGELMPGTITVCMQGTPLKVTAAQRL